MRVTCDIDSKDSFIIGIALLKGIYHLRKLPEKIDNTEKGVHIIYNKIDTDIEGCLRYRWIIGDDRKRISLDKMCRLKPFQVLFCEKETKCYGFIHRNWIKKIGAYNRGICACHKRVVYSEKLWTDSEKCFKIHHKDSVCTFPLKIRIPIILKAFGAFGGELA